MSNTNYPFSAPDGSSPPQSFPFDVVIQEAFPGLVKLGTEPNSVYTAFREVSGADWWVINADWDANQGFWTQNDSCNANLPAYAMAQDRNGTVVRYRTDATTLPNTQITWTPVWQIKDKGNLIRTPTAYQSAVTDMNNLLAWNMGTSTRAIARSTSITDTSSASNSMLEQNFVNNAEVWSIDKTGTLTAGIIPFARITGYTPPSFNNATFTGTTTFNGPVAANNGETVAGGLTVTGGTTSDTLHVTGNSTLNATTAASLNVTGNSVFQGTVTTTSGTPLIGLTSPTSTITVLNPSNNAYTVDVANPYPVVVTSNTTVPAVGSTMSISYGSNQGLPSESYVIVSSVPFSVAFLGLVVSNSISGNIVTSVIKVLRIQYGSVGAAIPPGSVINPGSYVPSLSIGSGRFQIPLNLSGTTSSTQSVTLPSPPGITSVSAVLTLKIALASAGTVTLTSTAGNWYFNDTVNNQDVWNLPANTLTTITCIGGGAAGTALGIQMVFSGPAQIIGGTATVANGSIALYY